MKKKFLTSLLIGAFIFGGGAANVQPVNAASQDKIGQILDGDGMSRPEPPKDSSGKPMAPPDKNNGDNSNRPEPPKDSNGNPMAPPNGENFNK